jgi:site-specific DNA recombinase
MNQKVVTYIRVSTEEQAKHGHSIETQRQLLDDYAKGHDLQIVRTFEETHSAHKPGRPEFAAMLTYIRKRKDIDAVLCYKLDRLARNLRDYSVLEEMEGMSIISVTEALPGGASGRFVATIHAAVSRLYSDQLGERVKHAAMTKVGNGGWPGQAPLGYLNNTDRKILILDPETAPVIKLIFETYARGNISLSLLVKKIKDLGLRTRSGSVLYKGPLHHILKNPMYCGMIRWEGNLYQGSHEPLVSKALFNAVQDRLRSKSSPQTKRSFAYRGLMTCGYCGCDITASLIKKKYTYYHCTRSKGHCPQKYVREERISELFIPIITNVSLDRNLIRQLRKGVADEGQRRKEEASALNRVLKQKQASLREIRDRGYEDKLTGNISEKRWLEMERRWSDQEEALLNQMLDLDVRNGPAQDEAEATFKLLNRASDLYQKQSHSDRGRLLKTLTSNSTLKDGYLVPVYRKPFDLVAEGLRSSIWLPG